MSTEIVVLCLAVACICASVLAAAAYLYIKKHKKNTGGGGSSASASGSYTGKSGTASASSYNIFSGDNTAVGALMQWKVKRDFKYYIAAVHSRDWKAYQYRRVRVTAKGKKPIDLIIGDACYDKDCGGDKNCCTRNAAKYANPPFLLDIDSRALDKEWHIKNAENNFFQPVQFQFGDKIDAKTAFKAAGAKWDG